VTRKLKATGGGERFLYFVRHGEYSNDDASKGALTPLGRRQAGLIAQYFRGLPVASVRSSDLRRAKETADILAARLRARRVTRHRVLREMLPAKVPAMAIPSAKRAEGKRRLQQILRRFFRPARGVRHEVVVCHGNLIRALVLSVAAGKPDGFHRFLAHHGSVTSFVVFATGKIAVVGFNSIAHMPERLRTHA
jgi:serine/threonine-protein phosphatase PGAM5